MFIQWLIVCLVFSLSGNLQLCSAQVILFNECAKVKPMEYFNMDGFLGKWYVIQLFPSWYDFNGYCAYKRIQACGRHIEVEHGFIRDDIQYVLHVNSSYVPGDEAVFEFQENNIDPIGIPMTVISTDYINYAVVYGCKFKEDMGLKYLTAWILSREPSLSEELLEKARLQLNSIPYANVAYLKPMVQDLEKCRYHWTAHVHAVDTDDVIKD